MGQPIPVSSTSWVLTLPGEGTQAHAGVTQLDEGAGALRQPQPCQQDVPATHVAMNQAFVFLEWGGKGAWSLGAVVTKGAVPLPIPHGPGKKDNCGYYGYGSTLSQ